MSTAITLNANGQFSLNQQMMEHLKVKAGDKLIIKKQADGSLKIEGEKASMDIMSLAGSLKSDIHLSLEQIEETIQNAYVAAGTSGLK